jgi:hypothetical protein
MTEGAHGSAKQQSRLRKSGREGTRCQFLGFVPRDVADKTANRCKKQAVYNGHCDFHLRVLGLHSKGSGHQRQK